MSIPNLPVDFKDDILASSNTKRKYRQTANDDSTVSFEDVTNYSQEGSEFGAKEVNQTNTAINNIYDERVLDVDALELITEPGFFVDAQAVKELNGKKIQLEEVYAATGLDKNLTAGQTSSNLFSQAVNHTGYTYIDVYTIFPAGSNRKMITLYKNGSEIKRYDDTTGTSGIGSKISVSAFVPVSTGDTITAQLFCAAGGMATSDVRIMAFY